MSARIHPTAVVSTSATLGAEVEIGPYCVLEGPVVLEERVRLVAHVVVAGRTRIGAGTVIWPFAAIGTPPQDLKYHGEPSELVVGARCRIREHVTMNTGTEGGGMLTRVGDDCLIMVGAHVAHDCLIGSRVILANNATLGGHVVIDDHAIIGGMSAVHQFVRIGAHAMIGGMSGVEQDVIPFGLVMGDRARLAGLNLVGLERRGFAREDINSLRSAYRLLFGPDGTLAERVAEVTRVHGANEHVREMVGFIQNRTGRALCQPRT